MNMYMKSALMAATIAGATAFVPTLASAQVGISVGVGPVGVGVYAPCGPGYGPCSEGYNPYEGDYYYDPIYFDGSWYHGPYRWREDHGQRVFWIDGGWHRNEWTGGPYPRDITFRNGGYYRGGRFDGFRDSDRINARFHSGAPMRDERGDMDRDHGAMDRDHGTMDRDHGSMSHDDQGDRHDDSNQPHN